MISKSIFCLILAIVAYCNAECPRIITKKMWGGRENQDVDYMTIPVEYALIEHTVTPQCHTLTQCSERVANIQTQHMDTNHYHDIGYNFLIGDDGNVYEGTGWHRVGAHAYKWNFKSLGITFIGNFSDMLPSQAALDAAKKLLECGVETGELSDSYKLLGHRQVIATLSPGTALFQEIVNWPHYSQENHVKK